MSVLNEGGTKRKFEFATESGTQEVVRGILQREFTAELQARRREEQAIRDRLDRAADLLHRVKRAVQEDKGKTTRSVSIDGRKVRVRVGAEKLFARLPDGSFIQFVCPTCKRDRFNNKLGFVNHCRILHKLKFASYEDASMHCGVLVDENEVPADDPSRQEQPLTQFQLLKFQEMHNLSQANHANSPHVLAWLALNSRVPTLSSFPSSSSSSSSASAPSASASSLLSSSSSSVTSLSSSTSGHPSVSSPTVSTTNGNPPAEMPTPGSKSVPSRNNSMASEDDLWSSTSSLSSSTAALQFISARRDPSHEQSSRFYVKKRIIVGNTSKAIPPERREKDDMATHKWMVYVRGPAEEPSISHFVSKVWFYLHASYSPNTVVEVYQPPFHLTRWGWGEFPVRVRLFFVDPKNKPIDIIHNLKLDTSLSGLQTLGGETPVDIELDRFFFESQPTFSCLSPLSEEGEKSMFGMNDDELEQIAVVMPEQGSSETTEWINQTLKIKNEPSEEDFISSKPTVESPTPPPTTTQAPSAASPPVRSSSASSSSVPDELSLLPKTQQILPLVPEITLALSSQLVNTCLRLGVLTYPLVTDNASITRLLTYACAPSKEIFLQWNLGKQRASEWQRARQLRRFLIDKVKADFTTRTLLYWCREKGHTPLTKEQEVVLAAKAVEAATTTTVDEKPTPVHHNQNEPSVCESQDNYFYCKYCGSLHLPSPATTFDGLQRQCAASSATSLPLRSHIPISELFPSLKLPLLPKQELVDTTLSGPQPTTIPFSLTLPASDTEPHKLHPSLDVNAMGWVHQHLMTAVFGNDASTPSSFPDAEIPPEPLILKATMLFAKSLIQEAHAQCTKQKDKDGDTNIKVVTPLHVHSAIKQKSIFDFLSNFGLGVEKNV